MSLPHLDRFGGYDVLVKRLHEMVVHLIRPGHNPVGVGIKGSLDVVVHVDQAPTGPHQPTGVRRDEVVERAPEGSLRDFGPTRRRMSAFAESGKRSRSDPGR